MDQRFLFAAFAIAVVLILSEQPASDDTVAPPTIMVGVWACLVIPPLFAAVQHILSRPQRRYETPDETGFDAVGCVRTWSAWMVWLAGSMALAFVFNWSQWVRMVWKLKVPLTDEILIASPMLLSAAMIGWIQAPRSREVDAQNALKHRRCLRWARANLNHFRLQYAWILLPILLLFFAKDIAAIIAPISIAAQSTSYLLLIFFLVLFYPTLMQLVWNCQPIKDKTLLRQLVDITQEKRVSKIKVRVWDTDGRALNALLLGVFRWQRCVVLTDVLLRRLNHCEIQAIFRHELGHVIHRHMTKRLLLLSLPLSLICLAVFVAPNACQHVWTLLTRSGITAWIGWSALMGWVAVYFLGLVVSILKRFEFQADLEACWDARKSQIDLDQLRHFRSALYKLADWSPDLFHRQTWVHPSIKQRIEYLRDWESAPAQHQRFRVFSDQILLRLAVVLSMGVVSLWLLAMLWHWQ